MEKALKIRESLMSSQTYLVADGYVRLGLLYAQFGNHKKGVEYANLAKQIWQQLELPPSETYMLNGCYAKIHLLTDQFETALHHYWLAVQQAKLAFGSHHPQVTLFYTGIVGAEFDRGNYQEVIAVTDTAIREAMIPPIGLEQGFSLASVTGSPSQSTYYLCALLRYCLESQFRLYQQDTSDMTYLRQGLETAQIGSQLLQTLKNKVDGEMTLVIHSQVIAQIYRIGLQMVMALEEKLGSVPPELPWFFMERTKAHQLTKAIVAAGADQFYQLPLHLLERQKQLRAQYARLETAFLEEDVKHKQKPDYDNPYTDSLFQVQLSLDALDEEIRKAHPDYHALKMNPTFARVREIRESVLKKDPGHVLIEYCWLEDDLFVLAIQQDTHHLVRLDSVDQITALCQPIRSYLAKPEQDSTEGLNTQLQALYRQVLQPVLELNYPFPPERLTIVPDGPLCEIPFEALRLRVGGNMSYLVEQYAISYGLSGTLLLGNYTPNPSHRNLKPGIKSFSPDYTHFEPDLGGLVDDSAVFDPLENTSKLLQQLADAYPVEHYGGSEATEATFKAHASGTPVLHLNAHGFFLPELPMHSGLGLVADTAQGEDGFLYTRELFNMAIHTELAILSACNTGYGALIPGENLMSFSRGFAYAGCPSMVTSLWEQSDAPTAKILESFYRYLGEGLSKDRALQQAKVDYLSKADSYNIHPNFWAAQVLTGNLEPIQLKPSRRPQILFISLALLVVLGGVILFKRRQSKSLRR